MMKMRSAFCLAVLAIILVFTTGCITVTTASPAAISEVEKGPSHAYDGKWGQGLFTIELDGDMWTGFTYNSDAREKVWSGYRGAFSEADGVLTWEWKEDYDKNRDSWYSVGGATRFYKWSVEGETLTLIQIKDGEELAPVVWTKQ